MGSLPMPPPAGGGFNFQQGNQAQYPPQGLQPTQSTLGGELTKGIAGFVTNYLAAKEGQEQRYKQKFSEAMQLKLAGIPINDEEAMKWAKKAGIPLKTEPYKPEEKAAMAKQKAEEALYAQMSQVASQPQLPGGVGLGMQQAAAQGVMQGPPPPPQGMPQGGPMGAQPGFMDRLKGMIPGLNRPQVSMDSPAGDWMNSLTSAVAQGGGLPGQIAAQGKMGRLEMALKEKGIDVSSMSMDQQKMLLNLTRGAIQGDPKALEMVTRAGILKDLPGDDLTRAMSKAMPDASPNQISQGVGRIMLNLAMGGPQMRMKMMDVAKELVPRFGGDYQAALQYIMDPSGAMTKPNFTAEEFDKLTQGVAKLHDIHPNAPANLLMYGALASVLPGQRGLLDSVMTTLSSNYKTSGVKADEKTAEDKRQFDVTSSISAGHLNVDQGSLALRAEVERASHALAVVKTVADNGNDEAKLGWEILNRKDSTTDQKVKAFDMIASGNNKKANLKLNYGGQTFTLGDQMMAMDQAKNALSAFFGREPGVQLNTPPPGSFTPQQRQPMQRGSHPPQRIGQALQGLPQDQQFLMLQRMFNKSADPTGQILDYIKQLLGQSQQ